MGEPESPKDSHPESPERTFGWQDMFVHPDHDTRTDGGFDNNERAMLTGFLRDRRLTLELKCDGLDAQQLAEASVAPSDLSLLGLVRHLTMVERYWFQHVIAGHEFDRPYTNEFDVEPDTEMVREAWSTWRAETAATDRVLAGIEDLGDLGKGEPAPIREVLIHLIREYSQHMGHADFLRERIDGRVGQ